MNVFHALLVFIGYSVSPDQYALTVVLHMLGIFTFGVVITLLFSMYTDCVEYGEWQTGRNNAGLTVSASMFSLKFGSAVGGALPGFILAGFGFVANVAQSDFAITGIRVMFNALPGVFFLAGGLLMFFYKIDRETLRRVERELMRRRGDGGVARAAAPAQEPVRIFPVKPRRAVKPAASQGARAVRRAILSGGRYGRGTSLLPSANITKADHRAFFFIPEGVPPAIKALAKGNAIGDRVEFGKGVETFDKAMIGDARA